MTGIALQQVAEGKLWAAVPLAIASHYALDDLNWGGIEVYHGLGYGWRKAAYLTFKAGLFLSVAYLIWQSPILLLGALAGMSLDVEHIYAWLFKKPFALGFHSRTWVLFGLWGIVAWVIISLLLMVVIWR